MKIFFFRRTQLWSSTINQRPVCAIHTIKYFRRKLILQREIRRTHNNPRIESRPCCNRQSYNRSFNSCNTAYSSNHLHDLILRTCTLFNSRFDTIQLNNHTLIVKTIMHGYHTSVRSIDAALDSQNHAAKQWLHRLLLSSDHNKHGTLVLLRQETIYGEIFYREPASGSNACITSCYNKSWALMQQTDPAKPVRQR